jgi:hypothetical protein
MPRVRAPIFDGMEVRMVRKPKANSIPGDLTEEEVTQELEGGLEDTFPASDPPAATQPVHKQSRKTRDA